VKGCEGCYRKTVHKIIICPVSPYMKECPCFKCLVKPMCVTDCDAFTTLRAKVFQMYIETLKKYRGELKGDNPSWVTIDEMRYDDEF
jgi:hypothetical protein